MIAEQAAQGLDSTTIVSVMAVLGAVILTLVKSIHWAVKYFLQKLLGRDGENGAFGRLRESIDGMSASVRENTEAVKELKVAHEQSRRSA